MWTDLCTHTHTHTHTHTYTRARSLQKKYPKIIVQIACVSFSFIFGCLTTTYNVHTLSISYSSHRIACGGWISTSKKPFHSPPCYPPRASTYNSVFGEIIKLAYWHNITDFTKPPLLTKHCFLRDQLSSWIISILDLYHSPPPMLVHHQFFSASCYKS